MEHTSTENYYNLLVALNEKVERITSCSHNTHPKLKRKVLVPYFYGSTSPDLEVNDKGEFILVSYEVIFTPAHLPGNKDSSLWKEDIRKFFGAKYENYDTLIMVQYEYYDAFVGQHLPSDMEIENCYGDRCRKEMHVYHSGIWCESCHGEFEDNIDFNLGFFINDAVYMKDFPKQCIISIKKKTKPVPDSFALEEHLGKLRQKVALAEGIKKRLETWEEETARLQRELLERREKEKQSLLSCQNKDYSSMLQKINNVLNHKKREKEIKEREEKIKALEEDNRRKREELEKQLRELEEEQARLKELVN
nr:hypothetical protein Cbor_38 [Cedratvirus borely]